MNNDISGGIELFNDFDFFSAHDFFENLWMNADKKDRLFFQGLVQVSVGSYHLINKNYNGALSQYKKGTQKLHSYVPVYKSLKVDLLLENIEILITDLELYFSDEMQSVDIDKIPKLEQL